jgi:DNA-directed RNA polymerase subunit H (RpoH/RPB5)
MDRFMMQRGCRLDMGSPADDPVLRNNSLQAVQLVYDTGRRAFMIGTCTSDPNAVDFTVAVVINKSLAKHIRTIYLSVSDLVLVANASQYARTVLDKSRFHIEYIDSDTFAFDRLASRLVVKYTKLNISSVQNLLNTYRVTLNQLPIITRDDIIVKYMGFLAGDVLSDGKGSIRYVI